MRGSYTLATGQTIARGINIPVEVGPYREHPYKWSWIYFHGIEDIVEARAEQMGFEWEAPDLVSASRAVEEIPDGVHRVQMGGNWYLLYLWSVDARTGHDGVSVRRRGLITGCDTETQIKADEYAHEKYQAREDML